MGALIRITVALVMLLWALVGLADFAGGGLPPEPSMAYVAHINRPAGPRNIDLYSPARQITVTVTRRDSYPLDVAAAPDGHRLALINRANTGDTLSVLNLHTGKRHTLTTRTDEIDNATWSPDSARIAYETRRNLHIIDALTGEQQQTLAAPPMTYPRWSPDAEQIAILVYPDIYMLDIRTEGVTRLVTFPQGRRAFTLAWSPDGRYLAYTRLPQDPNVYVYDMQTASVEHIRMLQLITVREIAWRDATRLTVVGGRTSITPAASEIDITTGDITRFPLPPDYSRELTWLP